MKIKIQAIYPPIYPPVYPPGYSPSYPSSYLPSYLPDYLYGCLMLPNLTIQGANEIRTFDFDLILCFVFITLKNVFMVNLAL